MMDKSLRQGLVIQGRVIGGIVLNLLLEYRRFRRSPDFRSCISEGRLNCSNHDRGNRAS